MVGELPEAQQAESETAWVEIPEASEGRCRNPSLDRDMEAEREVAPNASSLQEAPGAGPPGGRGFGPSPDPLCAPQ